MGKKFKFCCRLEPKALKEVANLGGNRRSVNTLAFSPDGSMLSAGDVSGTFFFPSLLD